MPERGLQAEKPIAEDREYNGYANYPTWVVHLWLANTEDAYHEVRELLADAGEPHQGAQDLKTWVESQSPIEETSMFTELLAWALQAVDWDEVAIALGPQEWETPPPAIPGTDLIIS